MADERQSKQDLKIAETRNRIEKENNDILMKEYRVLNNALNNLLTFRIEKYAKISA